MRLERFKAEHWHLEDPFEVLEAPDDTGVKLAEQGIAFTAFDGDTPVACGGFLFWAENEAEAWIRISKRIGDNLYPALKAISDGLAILRRIYDGQVFCWVDDSWPKAQRLVQWLGFNKTDTQKEHDGTIYFLWELNNGSSTSGSRVGSHSSGRDSTG